MYCDPARVPRAACCWLPVRPAEEPSFFEAPHRKTIQHFNIENHAHLLTFSCYRRRPLLNDDQRRTIFSRALDRANTLHKFQLIAFVYMPEHVHLLVFPKRPECKIEKLLYAIKKPSSDKMKQTI